MRTVDAQRDEIARFKGGPGRPNIKSSGMETATEPKASPTAAGEPRQKRSKTSKLTIHEERTVKLRAPPQGSRFQRLYELCGAGFDDHPARREIPPRAVANSEWRTMTAPLPAGICGHFGPELRRFVLAQYHQAQVTVAQLLALLQALGIMISKRLLIAGQDGFVDEARDVLRAGLSSAKWITVDDTGARHKATPGGRASAGHGIGRR
jgi:hypothetical protein